MYKSHEQSAVSLLHGAGCQVRPWRGAHANPSRAAICSCYSVRLLWGVAAAKHCLETAVGADKHCMEALAQLIGVCYKLGDHASLVKAALELLCRQPCNAAGHSCIACLAQRACRSHCCKSGGSIVLTILLQSFGNCLLRAVTGRTSHASEHSAA